MTSAQDCDLWHCTKVLTGSRSSHQWITWPEVTVMILYNLYLINDETLSLIQTETLFKFGTVTHRLRFFCVHFCFTVFPLVMPVGFPLMCVVYSVCICVVSMMFVLIKSAVCVCYQVLLQYRNRADQWASCWLVVMFHVKDESTFGGGG